MFSRGSCGSRSNPTEIFRMNRFQLESGISFATRLALHATAVMKIFVMMFFALLVAARVHAGWVEAPVEDAAETAEG